MAGNVIRFLYRLSVLTAILAMAGFVVFRYVIPGMYAPVYPVVLLIVFLFTFITHALQLYLGSGNFTRFARIHMVMTLLRLMLYSVIIVLYLLYNRENLALFLSVVGVLYIVYTAFAVRELTEKRR